MYTDEMYHAAYNILSARAEQLDEDELYHHGILGQKWGVRRYQNEDGSLTPVGKKRYSGIAGKITDFVSNKWNDKVKKSNEGPWNEKRNSTYAWDEKRNTNVPWNEKSNDSNVIKDNILKSIPKSNKTLISKEQLKKGIKKVSDMKIKQAKNDEKFNKIKKRH